MKEYLLLAFLVLVLPGAALSQESFYRSWDMGPPHDPSYFPIGVWLQDPRDASAYKAAGINLYVGLWEGPTLEQLQALKLSGMRVICPQNETGLEYRKEGIIAGWLHRDEPDNAQPRRSGFGYGSPIPPAQVEEEYLAMKKADPSRPVLLNLGQGAAWDGWWGRGSRSGHFEDYAEYVKGGDIISFDIYPVAHSSEKVAGKLELIGQASLRAFLHSVPGRHGSHRFGEDALSRRSVFKSARNLRSTHCFPSPRWSLVCHWSTVPSGID